MLKKCLQIALRSKRCINLVNREQVTSYSSYKRYENYAEKQRMPLPSRPLTFENQQLTNVVESTEEFKFVEKLIPSSIVPEPPKHDSYPTPSGWVPIDVEKASQLPYAVLRTRFHQFPMYPLEREGGSRKLVRIKNIDGDIWVNIYLFTFCNQIYNFFKCF